MIKSDDHKLRFRAVIGLVLVLVFGSVTARAETFHFATGTQYAPYVDEGVVNGGTVTHIVRRAVQILGYDVQIDHIPWARAFKAAAHQQVDGTFPFMLTPERAEYMSASDALLQVRPAIFHHKDDQRSMKIISDLKGLSTCQPYGYELRLELKQMVRENLISVMRHSDFPECLHMLTQRRLDFIYMSETVIEYYLDHHPEYARVLGKQDLPAHFTEPLHLMVAWQHPRRNRIISVINEGLRQLRKSGEMSQSEVMIQVSEN